MHIVYARLTIRLPGETPQQEQLLHRVQEQTQISPLLQSYRLPCPSCWALLGRHMNVLTVHTPGERQRAAPYCHQWGWLCPGPLLSGGFSSFSCRRCSVPQQASGKIQYCLQFLLIWYLRNPIQWGGAVLIKKKYGYGSNCQCIDRRNKFRAKLNIFFAQSPQYSYQKFCWPDQACLVFC